jgi:hypothetical protein
MGVFKKINFIALARLHILLFVETQKENRKAQMDPTRAIGERGR